jgi:hypothetical protein
LSLEAKEDLTSTHLSMTRESSIPTGAASKEAWWNLRTFIMPRNNEAVSCSVPEGLFYYYQTSSFW